MIKKRDQSEKSLMPSSLTGIVLNKMSAKKKKVLREKVQTLHVTFLALFAVAGAALTWGVTELK